MNPSDERKVALVTGAGSGIGRATAVLLAEAGYHVALVARTRSRLEETAELAGTSGRGGPEGVELMVLPADLRDPAATRAVIEHVKARFGRLNALAHVAGAAPRLPIERVTPEVWADCIHTNLSAAVGLTAAAWPLFRKEWERSRDSEGRGHLSDHPRGTEDPERSGRRGSVIVNISSLASVDPFPGFAIYAAAKIGLNMFTRCTAREGEEIGLRAVAVAPGAVETPMLRGLFDEKTIAADKTLAPEEVARVIVGCITGERAFESGETILLPSP